MKGAKVMSKQSKQLIFGYILLTAMWTFLILIGLGVYK